MTRKMQIDLLYKGIQNKNVFWCRNMHAVQNIECVCKAGSDGIFLKSPYLVIHKCQKKHTKLPPLYKR